MTALFVLLGLCGIGMILSGYAAAKWHGEFGWVCAILLICCIEIGSKIMAMVH